MQELQGRVENMEAMENKRTEDIKVAFNNIEERFQQVSNSIFIIRND
jgi:hypothetical protein